MILYLKLRMKIMDYKMFWGSNDVFASPTPFGSVLL